MCSCLSPTPPMRIVVEASPRISTAALLQLRGLPADGSRIVTFGTMAAKMVLKDVGRVLGETPGYTAKLGACLLMGD